MNNMQLYHGDCLKLLEDIADSSVDLVVTDPPYGIDYHAIKSGRGNLVNDDNLDWVDRFAHLISKKLKHGCHLYCFVDAEYSADFIIAFRKYGFKIRNLLAIPRGTKGNGGERIFQQQFEYCVFATLGGKNEGRKFNQTRILKPSEVYLKDKRYHPKEYLYRLPDYWHWTKASVHNIKESNHPTEKNVKCLENMIELSSNKGETVLDPFMGSGSTGVACKNLGRNFIGMEIEEKYFNIAKTRIAKVQAPLF